MVDLIPARKLERRTAVEQHQKELEIQFEARFPALYKKAQVMRRMPEFDEPPSPPPGSPPPPFRSEPRRGNSFKDVDWAGPGKDDDDDFDLRKAPLVGPLVSGLDKMREASHLPRSDPGTPSHGHYDDYPAKTRMDYYADDYDHDYDEIDPKSEGLRNDPGFQKAGVPGTADLVPGPAPKAPERGGDDSLKKAAKKRPQIWERLRSGGNK